MLENKKRIFDTYKKIISSNCDCISFMPIANYGTPNYWLTVIELDPKKTSVKPDQLFNALAKKGIESRPIWNPMHLQPVFKNNLFYGDDTDEYIQTRPLPAFWFSVN